MLVEHLAPAALGGARPYGMFLIIMQGIGFEPTKALGQ